MTHEKKIKALIENIGYLNAEDLAGVVYEAHGSIKLLAEIAEAAGEVRAAEKNMAREGNFEYAANADWGRKAYVLDTLLAKYKESQDAE